MRMYVHAVSMHSADAYHQISVKAFTFSGALWILLLQLEKWSCPTNRINYLGRSQSMNMFSMFFCTNDSLEYFR